jgi:hypothetical protein
MPPDSGNEARGEIRRFCSKFCLEEGELETKAVDISRRPLIQGYMKFSLDFYGGMPRKFVVLNRVPEGIMVEVTNLFPRWGELSLIIARRLAEKLGGSVKEIIDVIRGKRILVVLTSPDCIIIDVKTLIAGGG